MQLLQNTQRFPPPGMHNASKHVCVPRSICVWGGGVLACWWTRCIEMWWEEMCTHTYIHAQTQWSYCPSLIPVYLSHYSSSTTFFKVLVIHQANLKIPEKEYFWIVWLCLHMCTLWSSRFKVQAHMRVDLERKKKRLFFPWKPFLPLTPNLVRYIQWHDGPEYSETTMSM